MTKTIWQNLVRNCWFVNPHHPSLGWCGRWCHISSLCPGRLLEAPIPTTPRGVGHSFLSVSVPARAAVLSVYLLTCHFSQTKYTYGRSMSCLVLCPQDLSHCLAVGTPGTYAEGRRERRGEVAQRQKGRGREGNWKPLHLVITTV